MNHFQIDAFIDSLSTLIEKMDTECAALIEDDGYIPDANVGPVQRLDSALRDARNLRASMRILSDTVAT